MGKSEYIAIPDNKVQKILHSNCVKKFVQKTMEDVKVDVRLFSYSMKVGFGAYYKTKRCLLEDAVYQFITGDYEELYDIFSEDLIELIHEEVNFKITNMRELKSHIDGVKIVVKVDLNDWMRDMDIYMKRAIRKMTDEEIEKLIEELTKDE
jgi:hypothetical protein